MSTPIVTLIGQPNVGKSSLFNLLVGKQSAIVSAKAGVTRDRQFSRITHDDHHYWIVDTAGLAAEKDKLSNAMYQQSKIAADQANLVLLMIDASLTCQHEDIQLTRDLQKSKTPIILVLNKSDQTDEEILRSYMKLGIQHTIQISCKTKHGLNELKSLIIGHIPKHTEETTSKPTISLIGKPNAGKSTLTNLYAQEDRCIVSNQPGTTRDAISIDLEHNHEAYTLVDTAGMRRKNKIHEDIELSATATTLHAIDRSHTIIHLIDASEKISRQDFRLIQLCLEMGKSVVIAINKMDILNHNDRKILKKEIEVELSHLFNIPVIEISATQRKNTSKLIETAITMAMSMERTFSTSQLTRILERLVTVTPPPTRLGRPIKLRMAHISRQNPLRITIRGKRTGYLPKSYIRYLNKGFNDSLNLKGRYLELVLESDDNPFVD